LEAPSDYAAAFWRCDPISDEKAIITVSCSMPNKEGKYVSVVKSWSKELPSPVKFKPKIIPLPAMEEARRASPYDEAWNDVMEREVADRLLLFAHRALFKQCGKLFQGFQDFSNFGLVDNLLVFGPELHKFTGRICYSHMQRKKTVAIIAPDCQKNQTPTQSIHGWEGIKPVPSFSVDCAARKWDRSKTTQSKSKTKECLAAFQIIVPTGDGFNSVSQGTSKLDRGQRLWESKAGEVQNILSNDRHPVHLALWNNVKIYMPIGLKIAAHNAILSHHWEMLSPEIAQFQNVKDIALLADVKHELDNYFDYSTSSDMLKNIISHHVFIKAKQMLSESSQIARPQRQRLLSLAARDEESQDEAEQLVSFVPNAKELTYEELKHHSLGNDFF
jgi:hypothetical protein